MALAYGGTRQNIAPLSNPFIADFAKKTLCAIAEFAEFAEFCDQRKCLWYDRKGTIERKFGKIEPFFIITFFTDSRGKQYHETGIFSFYAAVISINV